MMASMGEDVHSVRVWRSALAMAALLTFASLAHAQDSAPLNVTPDPAQTQPVLAPPPGSVFGTIGKIIDQSLSTVGSGVGVVGAGVNAGVKGAGDTLGATTDAAGDIAKGATDAVGTVARLPATNIVSGHELCAAAPNGAPDCTAATLALCKSKGFERGNSVDITSAFKCPAQLWREGRAPNDRECRDESFVSKAMCQ